MKTPLYYSRIIVLILASTTLTGCLQTMDPRCRSYDYCAYSGQPRQYVRAPEGYGGKYCLQNPTEC